MQGWQLLTGGTLQELRDGGVHVHVVATMVKFRRLHLLCGALFSGRGDWEPLEACLLAPTAHHQLVHRLYHCGAQTQGP